jgi:REP element-mobilizing transposase RayT
MAIPYRGSTGSGTYFITASCYEKQNLLQSTRMAELLTHVLFHYQAQGRYLLHEFVVMLSHFHLLITPILPTTLENPYNSSREDSRTMREKSSTFWGDLADQFLRSTSARCN